MRRHSSASQPDVHSAARLILLQRSDEMAESKTPRTLTNRVGRQPATAHGKLALALKQAATQAQKRLAAQGLK